MTNNTYAGIPEEFAKLEQSKIVLIPVPFDGTSTVQKGAEKGPEALLKASNNMELYDIETDTEVYQQGITTLNARSFRIKYRYRKIHTYTLECTTLYQFHSIIRAEVQQPDALTCTHIQLVCIKSDANIIST